MFEQQKIREAADITLENAIRNCDCSQLPHSPISFTSIKYKDSVSPLLLAVKCWVTAANKDYGALIKLMVLRKAAVAEANQYCLANIEAPKYFNIVESICKGFQYYETLAIIAKHRPQI